MIIAADREIVIAGMLESQRMPGLVNQRRLAVAAGLQVEIVGLVLVDEGMALDVAIAAVRAVQERRVSRRLAGPVLVFM